MARIALVAAVAMTLTACQTKTEPFKSLTAGTVGTTTVAFQTADGRLKVGSQDIHLTFVDVAQKPVITSQPTLVLTLAAGGGSPGANLPVPLTETSTGSYTANVDLGSQGNWQGTVTWAEKGAPLTWSFASMVL